MHTTSDSKFVRSSYSLVYSVKRERLDFRRGAGYVCVIDMAQDVTSRSSALKRYGLVGLGFIHIGVGRGLHGTLGVFFVALLDAFGWSRA